MQCPKCPNLRKTNSCTISGKQSVFYHRCAISNKVIISESKGFKNSPNGIRTPINCPNNIIKDRE